MAVKPTTSDCCFRQRELLLECVCRAAEPSLAFELLLDPLASTQPEPLAKPVERTDHAPKE